MAIKTLRVFQEFTVDGYIPMPVDGNIDYGYTIAGTFPSTTPSTFQTDDPDLDVTLTETTDYYVWIRSNGTAWNPMYTRNVRVYPDSPSINNVVMGIIIANLNSTVPYEGATENVDLGEFGIKAGYVGLDLTPTSTPTTEGTMSWDSGNGTANLTLKGGEVNLAIGQEMVARVYNDTGSILNDGQIVYITGAQGNRIKVGLASNATEVTSSVTFGMVTETIAIGAEGFVTVQGTVNHLNTVGLTEGAQLWLGNTPGTYTETKPVAPLHAVLIGYVERVHATVGSIYVKVQNGYELEELHDVLIDTPLTNDVLIYNGVDELWGNKPLVKTNGYIPYFDDVDLFLDSPIYTDGIQVAVGGTSFTSTNKLTIHGDMSATNITATSFNGYLQTAGTGGDGRISYNGGYGVLIRGKTGSIADTAIFTPDGSVVWENTTATINSRFYGNVTVANIIRSGGTSSQYLMADGSVSTLTNPITGSLTAGFVPLASSSTVIGNSQIYDNGSGIGIGMTTPSAAFGERLNVTSSTIGRFAINHTATTGARISDIIFSENSTNIAQFGAILDFGGIDNQFWIRAVANIPIAFRTNDVERARITDDGNFLVGTTTNSGYKADINGSFRATSIIKSGGTSTEFLKADGSVDSNTYLTTSSAASTYQTILTNPVTGTGTAGYLGYWSGTSTMTGSSSLFWNNTTKALGIGTVSALLETNRNGIVVRGGSAGAEFVLQSTSSTDGTYDGFSMAMEANQAFLYNKRNGSIKFGANNALKAELKTNGDFDITGAYLVNGVPISTSGITGTLTSGFVPKATGASTVGNSALYDAGSYVMGIGTTSPLLFTGRQGLVIRGTGAELLLQSTNSTDGTYDGLAISMDADTAYIFNKRNGDLQLGANNARRATLTVGGDFDITGTYKVNGVALSSGIGGSGTASYIPKFATGTTLGNSGLYDGGTYIDVTYGALRIANKQALSDSSTILNVGFSGFSSVEIYANTTSRIEANSQGVKLNIPTSSAGLSSGQLWNDSGTVKIV